MVRIIDYKKRQAEDGREFFVLELSGGIEMVKSQTGYTNLAGSLS